MEILLTSIVSLLAAMIGGWIAGTYALRAQKQAAEHQRWRDLEGERRAVNSILQAIGTELTVLKHDFLDRLQQADDAQELAFQIRGPLSRNYFAVFESNAAISKGINVFRGRLRLQRDTRRLPNPRCLPDSATHF